MTALQFTALQSHQGRGAVSRQSAPLKVHVLHSFINYPPFVSGTEALVSYLSWAVWRRALTAPVNLMSATGKSVACRVPIILACIRATSPATGQSAKKPCPLVSTPWSVSARKANTNRSSSGKLLRPYSEWVSVWLIFFYDTHHVECRNSHHSFRSASRGPAIVLVCRNSFVCNASNYDSIWI